MVQNKEIKMAYLIFVVFLSVLGVSGEFRAIFEFCPLETENFQAWAARAHMGWFACVVYITYFRKLTAGHCSFWLPAEKIQSTFNNKCSCQQS